MIDNLLPCPFCGSSASLTKVSSDNGVIDWWLAECDDITDIDCGARSQGFGLKVHATQAWNRRAATDASGEKAGITQAERAQRTSEHSLREALQFFLDAEKAVTDYENGEWSDEAVDGAKIYHDIELARENARAALSSTGDERREAIEHALRMPTNGEIRLAAGEFTTAQELRSAKAVLAWRLRVIRSLLHADGGEKP